LTEKISFSSIVLFILTFDSLSDVLFWFPFPEDKPLWFFQSFYFNKGGSKYDDVLEFEEKLLLILESVSPVLFL